MAEPSNPTILVDVHEKRSGIAAHLEQLGAQVEIHALPAGDYVVGEATLVEHKRVLDLHAAVVKGHFWAQIGKLRAASPFPSKSRDLGEAAEAMLASLPGISTKTARSLFATFGSVEAVIGAGEKELLRVPGVGPQRARALLETLTQRHAPPAR